MKLGRVSQCGNGGRGPQLTYRTIHRRTFSWKLRKSAKPERKLSDKNPVLLVRRRIDDKGRYFDTQVDIKSPVLAQALIEINEGVEGLKLKRSPPEVRLSLLPSL